MTPKTLKIIYWAITVLFFGFLAFGAVTEVMQAQAAKDLLVSLGYPLYLNYILGVAKLLGFLAIIQWKWPTLKEWSYAGFTIDIIGAAASSYFSMGVGGLFVLVFLIPLFISYCLWKKIEMRA